MLRAILAIMLLVLGAVALARGMYLRAELIQQLETGTMGYVRSWIMWSTTDGRELVAWYRMVTPWLIWGGAASLVSGLAVAVWPASVSADGGAGKAAPAGRSKPPKPRRKARS